MKIISWLGIFAGIQYLVTTIIHNYIQYPDVSEFIGNFAIGIIIIFGSIIFNQICELERAVRELKETFTSFEGYVVDKTK